MQITDRLQRTTSKKKVPTFGASYYSHAVTDFYSKELSPENPKAAVPLIRNPGSTAYQIQYAQSRPHKDVQSNVSLSILHDAIPYPSIMYVFTVTLHSEP